MFVCALASGTSAIANSRAAARRGAKKDLSLMTFLLPVRQAESCIHGAREQQAESGETLPLRGRSEISDGDEKLWRVLDARARRCDHRAPLSRSYMSRGGAVW